MRIAVVMPIAFLALFSLVHAQPAPPPVLEQHAFLKSRTVGIPSFVDGAVHYDPSFDQVVSTGAGQVTYQIPLDGGMRPRFVSVEAAGDDGKDVDVTVIVRDHSSGAKHTAGANDDGSNSLYHWIDVPVTSILGTSGGALPRANQATMTVRVEFAGAMSRTRRVVMFYDRPTPIGPAAPFPDVDPGDLGDLSRLLSYF